MKTLTPLAILACCSLAALARAAGPDDAKGLWMTAQNDAVIRFAPCAEAPGALCGTIVWDKDAGTAADTCGVRVAQLARHEKEAWRDGWVYDPRENRKYKGIVRVQDDELRIRAFVGVEILGQTEQLRRVPAMPAAPVCKP
jgi:uncharacterized protein (DUF2147 family)